ncbi:uncharacterized protein LOC129575736 [Sitodiplosis mosellana]|uniref:uncharacterized protein LOC129575736 n=1 Tax=Sitodiplosis mosellana TaxID=263140 RepID=UPI002444E923|nr:uncharacterized protein LOC129575736 [Sitodiplosis mosellana]
MVIINSISTITVRNMFWLTILMVFSMGKTALSEANEEKYMTLSVNGSMMEKSLRPNHFDNSACSGFIEYIRLDQDTIGQSVVLKFKDKPKEFFTRVIPLFDALFDIFLQGMDIQLITNSCEEGNDHGFAAFQILNMYDQ